MDHNLTGPEVLAFMRASETLLSAASINRKLSEYVTTLSSSSNPWSKELLARPCF